MATPPAPPLDPTASPPLAGPDKPPAGDRRAVALEPATPPATLVRLALDGSLWVRTAAAAHPAFPPAARELFVRAGSTPDLAGFGAPDPTLAPDRLAELAAAGEWGSRLAARHPATPPATLRRLADHPSALLRADLAGHPAAPPEGLARLLADGEIAVRRRAAEHPRAPAEVLELLRRAGAGPGLTDPGTAAAARLPEAAIGPPDSTPTAADPGARQTAARPETSPTAPGGTTVATPPALTAAAAEALAGAGPFGRRLAARLPALPAAAVAALAADPDAAVRLAAAANPRCPPEVLVDLAGDAVPAVRGAVARHPAAPAEALARLLAADPGDVELHAAVAAHPAAGPDLLASLAEHGSHRVRAEVGRHPSYPAAHRALLERAGSTPDLAGFGRPDPTLPAAELARLARGGVWARRLAARHPATAPADLAGLLADEDLLVRRGAARNPGAPAEALALLRRAGGAVELDGFADQAGEGPPLAAGELAALAAGGPWARRLVARHPACPPGLLAVLVDEPDPRVRAAVAAHPAAPPAALEALSGDPSAAVRWAVVRHPAAPPEALRRFARDPLAPLRAAAAAHPAAPADALAGLGLDLDEDVREAASGRAWSTIATAGPASERGE
jgi:hypothetical protein